jgi:hypothetical protein
METVGGPDAKKARWSPNSAFSSQNSSAAAAANASARDAFANYGYGPQANIAQPAFSNSQSNGFGASPLYSTPSLTVNTQANGNVMNSQLSPNTAAAAFAVQQQQQQQQQQGTANGNYNAFNAYNMLGMGMPNMGMLGGFPYTGQMGNFGQVIFVHYHL